VAKKFLSPITLPSLSSDPSGGENGSLYFNSTSGTVKVYTNSGWIDLAGSTNSTGVDIVSSYQNLPSNGQLAYNTTADRMALAYNNIWREFAYKADTDIVNGGDSSTTDFDLVLDGGGSSTETFIGNYYP